MARIYDVDHGSVCIGGENIRNIRLQTLRRYVCYLPREPALFNGTLAFNLRFVKPAASDEELRDAAANASLCEFIQSLPKGFDQRVGPGACQLSGGERQRLAIARALLQRPQILILDEATSCLDPFSEELVLENVSRYLRESTVVVVSHRESTLSKFGRNIVISAGEIVTDGIPDTLLLSGSLSTLSSQAPATAG
jgi:ATP-binding cassette subfamily B protein